jgi:hypothetical protein
VSLQSEREYEIENPSLQDIYVKLEYYLHRADAFYPFLRIDTLYQLREENLKAQGTNIKLNDLSYFNRTIRSVIEKTDFDKLVTKITEKRKFASYEINAFNNRRFDLPVLTAVKYNEGVFLSSKEFINNNPSIKSFTINKKGKLAAYGNGKEKFAASWAFADSNGLHKRSANNVEIFRTGNTFEFFNEETVHVSRTIAGIFFDALAAVPMPGTFMSPVTPLDRTSVNTTQTRVKTIIVPRQLNMETGEIY